MCFLLSCCLNAESPCPGHSVVNIKLDEKLATEQVNSVGQPATFKHVLSENVLEMNYNSGEWRWLLFKRTKYTQEI